MDNELDKAIADILRDQFEFWISEVRLSDEQWMSAARRVVHEVLSRQDNSAARTTVE